MKFRQMAWLCVLLCACAPLRPAEPAPPTTRAAPRAAAVIAHRGGAALAPENTLAAFRNALALGVDVLEMDAHMTRDGVPVVIHDATLERTTDGTGRVGERTLAELQALNAAAKFGGGGAYREAMPTFAQVLDLARDGRTRMEVEIKVPPQGRYAGIESAVVRAAAERNMRDRVQVSSFHFGVLADVKRADPQTRTVALMGGDFFRRVPVDSPELMVAAAQSAGAEVIAVDKDYLTAAAVQAAHARGLMVEVWTVDAESDMMKFISMGGDGIISNHPDLLRRVTGK